MVRQRMVVPLVVCLATLCVSVSCESSRDDQAASEQAANTPAEHDIPGVQTEGCLCMVNAETMTISVAPLLRDAEDTPTGFDTSQPLEIRIVSSTVVRAEGSTAEGATVARILGGEKPREDLATLADLPGHKVVVTWQEQGPERVSSKITLVIGFRGETLLGMGGAHGFTVTPAVTRCTCDAR